MRGLWFLGLVGLVLVRWADASRQLSNATGVGVGVGVGAGESDANGGDPLMVELTLIESAVSKGAGIFIMTFEVFCFFTCFS